jgi:hypothetical protein
LSLASAARADSKHAIDVSAQKGPRSTESPALMIDHLSCCSAWSLRATIRGA